MLEIGLIALEIIPCKHKHMLFLYNISIVKRKKKLKDFNIIYPYEIIFSEFVENFVVCDRTWSFEQGV